MPNEYTLIGGNGTVVSELTVTANGTYKAGDSKAYNPVIVNVEASASPLSTFTMTVTTVSGEPSSYGIYALYNSQITDLSDLLGESAVADFSVIAINGSCSGVLYTKEEITTYSGSIVLGEPVHDEGYATPVTITGDCAVTLVGDDYG